MKIISIGLTVLLFVPLVGCMIGIFQTCYLYNSPLIPNTVIFDLATPYVINGSVLFICFLIALYLNIKKKYTANIVMSSVVIVLHLIAINFTSL